MQQSGLFELVYADQTISSGMPFEVEIEAGSVDFSEDFEVAATLGSLKAKNLQRGVEVSWQRRQISAGPVWELQLAVLNIGNSPLKMTRLDSASLRLGGGPWLVESFASAWGDEFRPQAGSTRHDSFFDVRSGRSSHGEVPLVYFVRESDGFTVILSPAWSGNWHVDVFAGGWVRAGISTWNFEVTLQPQQNIEAPSVVLAAGSSKLEAQQFLQEAVRDNWLARSAYSDQVPIEWNHWWPYEDVDVTEGVIHENVSLAKRMPIDAIVVDAGWFGSSELDTKWVDLRGDWASVNLARFPAGLEELGARIRESGMVPGIWMEIEAVGASSRLRQERPEVLARNDLGDRPDPSYRVGTVSLDPADPGFLGYVCLGSDSGWEHCFNSIESIVGTMGARWLKVDFNIDPGRGCTRTDHGHGEQDGLYWHYQGLYRLLDKVRDTFPDLLVEACSSGGLRIDLGLARHVHCFFLSDPDYTEHHLEALWGASQMLPPLAILHWPWSWWRNEYQPSQLDWQAVDADTFDVMVRAAMLHRIGISYPLPLMPELLSVRLSRHLQVYKRHVVPILKSATLLPLTKSPTRAGGGVRFPALQLSSVIDEDEVHLVMAAGLDPGSQQGEFDIQRLQPDSLYHVLDTETEEYVELQGRDISSKVLAKLAGNARSWICELRRKKVNH